MMIIRKTSFVLTPALLALVVTAATGCARSNEYQKDQEYFRGEPLGYYGKGGPPRSASQRVEAAGQPRKRVLILNFWNDTPVRQGELGPFAAEELRRALHVSGRVIIPTDIRTELATPDFVQGDRVRVAQLIREGRRLGVSVLAIGRVTKAIFRTRGDEVGLFRQKQSLAAADVEVKVFDIQAGREILAVARSAESANSSLAAFDVEQTEKPEFRAELTRLAIRDAMAQVAGDVIRALEKLTWQGRIAKIAGSKVYVNAGRASGIVGGDILKVLTPGDDIFDPANGAFLGRSPGQLKGTIEVHDFIGEDGAAGEVHTGGNFREGDVVQLY